MLQRSSPWFIPHHPLHSERRTQVRTLLALDLQLLYRRDDMPVRQRIVSPRLSSFIRLDVLHPPPPFPAMWQLPPHIWISPLQAAAAGEQTGGCREWDKGFFFFFSRHSCNTICSLAGHLGSQRGPAQFTQRAQTHADITILIAKAATHAGAEQIYVFNWLDSSNRAVLFICLQPSSSFSLFGLQ